MITFRVGTFATGQALLGELIIVSSRPVGSFATGQAWR